MGCPEKDDCGSLLDQKLGAPGGDEDDERGSWLFCRVNLPSTPSLLEPQAKAHASARQYKRYFKTWGLVKNIKTDDMKVMLHIQRSRRRINKETRFTRHGVEVRQEKLCRFAKRNNIGVNFRLDGEGALTSLPFLRKKLTASPLVTTPPGVRYSTPEPEDSVRALPMVTDVSHTTSPAASSPDLGPHGIDAIEMGLPEHPPSLPTAASDPIWSRPMPDMSTDYAIGGFPALISCSATPLENQTGSSTHTQFPRTEPADTGPLFSPTYLLPQDMYGLQLQSQPRTNTSAIHEALVDPGHDWTFALSQPPSSSRAWRSLGPGNSKCLRPSLDQAAVGGYSSWSDQPTFATAVGPGPNAHFETGGFVSQSGPMVYDLPPTPQEPVHESISLHMAVINGNSEQAKILLDLDTDPNVPAFGGTTPLHFAAFRRDLGLITLLLEHGASLDVLTDKGQSILFFAVCSRDRLERDNKLPPEDWQASDVSIADDLTMQVIEKLYSSPSSWSSFSDSLGRADNTGVTPLMAAAERGLVGTVTMFLRRGARPDVKDRYEHTALKYAATTNRGDLVQLLLEADSRVQKRNVKHMLKLATRNLAGGPITEGPQEHQQRLWFRDLWTFGETIGSGVIADVMVPMYEKLGALDDVIELAKQQGQTGMVEFLLARRATSGG